MGYVKQRTLFMLRRSCVLWMCVFAICLLIILFRADDKISESIENYIKRRDAEISRGKDSHSGQVDETFDMSQLNVTANAEIDVLFFNRVPKVGSQTFMELMKRLADQNGYVTNKDVAQRAEQVRMNQVQEQNLAELIAAFEPPSTYTKHVSFVNFTKYNLPMPLYLNVVRDPVERVISWFYYIRTPWYLVDRKTHFPEYQLPTIKWLKKDYETCVLTGDPECVYIQGDRSNFADHRRQAMFFCGHEDDCAPFNSQKTMEKAIKHVEENYAVVGVLEELDMTMTVLENYLPKYFKGASQVFKDIEKLKINGNSMKPPVSDHVKDIVRRNFSREMEFYDFCRHRLHKQFHALKHLNIEADQR